MPDLSDKVSDMQRFNELPQEVRDEIAVLLAAIGDPNATDEDANINGIINYAQSVVALRTRPPASSMEGWRQPEPVAWRYLFDVEAEEGLDWEYRAERPAFTPFGEEYVTVEPLYAAAPSQPPSAEGWRTMDSAPKDGEWVWLWNSVIGRALGFYGHEWNYTWCEEPADVPGEPTLWQPLPSSPIPPEVMK